MLIMSSRINYRAKLAQQYSTNEANLGALAAAAKIL
jgi:hypothetical protein